mmetsp:Transcript_121938/g.352189  ORF Transcript_121938/g.352189 Transcript_121938/m.352189 type:complete len:224 (-) Transcript_121938:133-804(-)
MLRGALGRQGQHQDHEELEGHSQACDDHRDLNPERRLAQALCRGQDEHPASDEEQAQHGRVHRAPGGEEQRLGECGAVRLAGHLASVPRHGQGGVDREGLERQHHHAVERARDRPEVQPRLRLLGHRGLLGGRGLVVVCGRDLLPQEVRERPAVALHALEGAGDRALRRQVPSTAAAAEQPESEHLRTRSGLHQARRHEDRAVSRGGHPTASEAPGALSASLH